MCGDLMFTYRRVCVCQWKEHQFSDWKGKSSQKAKLFDFRPLGLSGRVRDRTQDELKPMYTWKNEVKPIMIPPRLSWTITHSSKSHAIIKKILQNCLWFSWNNPSNRLRGLFLWVFLRSVESDILRLDLVMGWVSPGRHWNCQTLANTVGNVLKNAAIQIRILGASAATKHTVGQMGGVGRQRWLVQQSISYIISPFPEFGKGDKLTGLFCHLLI